MSGILFTEIFGRGWTRARGETEGFAWIGDGIASLRFPRFAAIAGRRAESIAWAPDPQTMMSVTTAAFADEADHWIVTFEPSCEPPADYAAAGWRVAQKNWLMTRPPLAVPACSGLARDVRPAEAASIVEAGLSAQVRPEFFDAPGFRLLGVFDDDDRCIATGRTAHATDSWVVIDGMTTRPESRGRGHGADILAQLLVRAVNDGRPNALLVATDQGRRLYERFGFTVEAACFAFQQAT